MSDEETAMNLRSNAANSPSRRANWRALGLSKEDMEKPKIAVVNSSGTGTVAAQRSTSGCRPRTRSAETTFVSST